MKRYWCYPYLYIKEMYIPLAAIAIYVISIGVLAYGLYHRWKHRHLQTIKWKEKFKYLLTVNAILIFMLFAFSRTDSSYLLYMKVKDIFEIFRQVDIFLYVWIFLLLLIGIRYRNRYTYINTLMRHFITINYFELFSCAFGEYAEGTKGYLPFWIRLCIGCSIAIINTILQNFEFCKVERKVPSIHNNELFQPRRKQMDDILNKILTYADDKQMSIFISDEWGGGKTFFASYLYKEIKRTKVQNIIWINLIDFNDEESFIKQVFRKIQIELNSNNYYTGWTSEFERYFEIILSASAGDTITKSLLEKIRINQANNYVSLTERLEEFSQMLEDNKIIIIIDDMDRCTDNTINAALKLFSEIIMLPKSIRVFVGDYEQLRLKSGFGNNYFDKYFMYNYNLKAVPYKELFRYYQNKISFKELDLPIEVDLFKEIQTMLQDMTQWYVNEEKHGIAEQESLNKGQMRKIAVQESIELVRNMKEGIYELEKKLSNPRRVQWIFNEIYEKLSLVSKAVKENDENLTNTRLKLKEIVLPAIMFYSFARNLCIDQFWDICVDGFADFSDKVLETIYEMSIQNDESCAELEIYRLLVYYYFSTRFQKNENRSKEFKEFYMSTDLRTYFKSTSIK